MVKQRGLLGYTCLLCRRKKRYKLRHMVVKDTDEELINRVESDHLMTSGDYDPCNTPALTVFIVDVIKP